MVLLQITTISNLRHHQLMKKKKINLKSMKLLPKQRKLLLIKQKQKQRLQKRLKKSHSCLLTLRSKNSRNNLLSNNQLPSADKKEILKQV